MKLVSCCLFFGVLVALSGCGDSADSNPNGRLGGSGGSAGKRTVPVAQKARSAAVVE